MDDLINRQQAIDAIEELMTRYFDRKVILAKAQDAVNNVPSVQPEQRWTPCDWCRYNPPSSMDGKPCTVCPAAPYQKEGGK